MFNYDKPFKSGDCNKPVKPAGRNDPKDA